MHPKELRIKLGKEGLIPGGLGNFGHIVYGSSVVIIMLLLIFNFSLEDYITLLAIALGAKNSLKQISPVIISLMKTVIYRL